MAIVNPDDSSVTGTKDVDTIDPHVDVEYNAGLRTLGSVGDVSTRVELDLAYSSEKLLNLDILLTHVAKRACDCEALVIDDGFAFDDSAEKVLEVDILSGILHSEVKELDDFMIYLQEEIMDACEKISSTEHLKEAFVEMEEKLHDSEQSLKQLQDRVAEMRMQLAKFQNTFGFGGLVSWSSGISEISHLPAMHHSEMKMQTSEEQRHILKMLEKSLARELDLEKWLSESRHNEEELKLKLHFVEQEMEEITNHVFERLFEAENISAVMMSISKELSGKLQIVQLNLNSLMKREDEVRGRLHDSIQKLSTKNAELDDLKVNLKKAEDEYNHANSEAMTFREKVISLEEKLMDSDIQLKNAKASVEESQQQKHLLSSKIINMEILIENLRADVLKMESKVGNSESQCKFLTETNSKLREEFNSLCSSDTEKVSLLEKQLSQSETQLQHAKASLEASQEKQNMLSSALTDMGNLIEDLKTKALKAEVRAESTEAKCILLTEKNLELNEELGFLRGRVECLETSLRLGDNKKIAIANDIGIRSKVISNLIMKLATERERLHKQISSLAEENKILVGKSWKTRNDVSVVVSDNANLSKKECFPKSDSLKSFEDSVTDSSVQMDRFAKGTSKNGSQVEPAVSTEDTDSTELRLDAATTAEQKQYNLKHVFMAVLVLIISVAVVYLFQLEKCPF